MPTDGPSRRAEGRLPYGLRIIRKVGAGFWRDRDHTSWGRRHVGCSKGRDGGKGEVSPDWTICLRACFKIGRGPADCGQGGEFRASPGGGCKERPNGGHGQKSRRPGGFSRKRPPDFVAPRSQTHKGYAPSYRLVIQPFARKQVPCEF